MGSAAKRQTKPEEGFGKLNPRRAVPSRHQLCAEAFHSAHGGFLGTTAQQCPLDLRQMPSLGSSAEEPEVLETQNSVLQKDVTMQSMGEEAPLIKYVDIYHLDLYLRHL